MLTLEQMILILIWAILAFVIQPHYLMVRISAKYRDKEWVDFNLSSVHEQLGARLLPLFDNSLSNHMQTFKAQIFRPIQAQAGHLNGEIEEVLESYVEDQISIPPQLANEAMGRVLKKYPSLALLLPILQGNIGNPNTQRGGYLPPVSDGGEDF